jgi:uncharacterized protein
LSAGLAARERRLGALLRECESVIVAFSGGADSAFLAWAATRALGARALAVTAESPSYPDHHRQLARTVARDFGLRHEVLRTGEFDRAEYRANPTNRCYFCKHELYGTLTALASARGVAVVADGSNADDRDDYRPGRRAAREFGVRSPLDEAGLGKADVRALSRAAGLPTWDEPASACLSSRIPYHSPITAGKLRAVERGEAALRALGFRVCRVRHHDGFASVEVALEELGRALEPVMRGRIETALLEVGYQEVRIDPRGYRMGSLNGGVMLRAV